MGSARTAGRKEPEGWITFVECLQAPSGWCSRFGAAAGVAEAAAEAAAMLAGGTAAAAVAAERAPARPDCAITTAVTSSTRSRWSVPPSGAARAFPPPRRPVTAAASSMAAGRRFTASPVWCPLRLLHLRTVPSQVSSSFPFACVFFSLFIRLSPSGLWKNTNSAVAFVLFVLFYVEKCQSAR